MNGQLPSSWTRVTLGNLLAEPLRNGRSVPDSASGFPVLRLTAIRETRVRLDEHKLGAWSEDQAEPFVVEKDDFLVARGNGSLDLVGRGGLVGHVPRAVAFPDTMIRVRPRTAALGPEYLRHLWNSPVIRAQIEQSARTTAGIYKINQEHLRQIQIPLPPRPEQDRIANALDTQTSRLDTAAAGLRRVRANLKRYRASVLRNACEGRLVSTEAELARREGQDFEPASILLARILKERRAMWEEQELAKLRTQGKEPKDDRWKLKYKDPERPNTNGLPELPEGWVWTTLAAITQLRGGLTKGQKRQDGRRYREVPYLRVANVQRGYLDLGDVARIHASEDDIRKLALRPGDVLFNEGGDRDKLGRGWVWSGELPECIHQNHVFRARVLTTAVQPKYLSFYGNSAGQTYFTAQGRQTTNLASINLTKLGALPVPLPPAAEQLRIVQEVKRLLEEADVVEGATNAGLRRAGRLHQSLRKRAFEGQLVAQDPDDEPASVLLERIQAKPGNEATVADES